MYLLILAFQDCKLNNTLNYAQLSHINVSLQLRIRVRPRFFDQVGHETMYASSVNEHFCTKSCHPQTYQNMNRANKNRAQF